MGLNHLMNYEELLGLHRDDIIPLFSSPQEMNEKSKHVRDGAVAVPREFEPLDIINLKRHSTALFILRIHLAIMAFAGLVLIIRWRIS